MKRGARPLTDCWRRLPVAQRGTARLGLSYRPLQAAALGLDPGAVLRTLLAYPFELIRIGAYWDRLEPVPGGLRPGDLDRQLDAAERAGKQVIVCVGAVKSFGYPEFFVPPHHLHRPLREGAPGHALASRTGLLAAAITFVTRVGGAVLRSRGRSSRGRLSTRRSTRSAWSTPGGCPKMFVARRGGGGPRRRPGPTGHDERLPAHLGAGGAAAVVADQGSGRLARRLPQRLADIVGIDCYPRHALASRRAGDPVPRRQPVGTGTAGRLERVLERGGCGTGSG